jgi:hypothetical protein
MPTGEVDRCLEVAAPFFDGVQMVFGSKLAPSKSPGYPGEMPKPDDEDLQPARRPFLRGISAGVAVGFLTAFMVQTLVPSLARVPGFLLCGGDSFELVLRRKTSFGLCGDGTVVHYGLVLVVSWLVWAVVFAPIGMIAVRFLPKESKRPSP